MNRFAASLLFALLLVACEGQPAGITIANAVYRAPLVDGAPGVAYFSITSPTNDRIVGISSPESQSVEIHESTEHDGVSAMEKRETIALPAGKTVTFGPGGLHVMVIAPIPKRPSATFPIQITLESGRVETISIAGETTSK